MLAQVPNKFDFKELFTFEMANNHQGSMEHGARIIQEIATVAKEMHVRGAIKIQLRDLDTFIHPSYTNRKDIKHIPRFLDTRLTTEQFKELLNTAKKLGLLAMATPFDERSVKVAVDLGVDIIKVASCSAHDWPLLEEIASTGKPVIVSTGGLLLHDVDKIVSFFEHRGINFALMHCVAQYHTPIDELHLDNIPKLKARYPHIIIGFSTHEDPNNTTAIGLAYARGARIFEKHVGVATDTIKLNAYSATPKQVKKWLQAYQEAVAAIGENKERMIADVERADLDSLMRGVFVSEDILAGSVIDRSQVYFAMPLQPGQLTSGSFKKGLIADRDYKKDTAISAVVAPKHRTKKDVVYSAIHIAKGMLNEAKIPLSHDFKVELSHHYGLGQFHTTGCMIIDCINREYAKKLIIQFPGQMNPTHYHKAKDETFHVLSGELIAEIEGKTRLLTPGDTLWVPRGVWHSFWTETGVIVEEVSTTAMETQGDSFYIDRRIANIPREDRKTKLMNWGRHQFDDADEVIA